MNTHLNSIRTIALVCIAGKAISVGFSTGEASLATFVNASIITFLMKACSPTSSAITVPMKIITSARSVAHHSSTSENQLTNTFSYQIHIAP